MATRAKASEPSEPEREAGIVRVDEPVPSGDAPSEVNVKSAALPAPSDAPGGPPPNVPPALPVTQTVGPP